MIENHHNISYLIKVSYYLLLFSLPSPERGVLVILIEELDSKSSPLLFTLISACERLKIRILFHTSSR